MLIPQQLSYGPASVVSSGNPIANHPQSVNGIRNSTTGSSAVRATVYPSVDGRMFATKMQSDIPGFNMYAAAAAAAAATGQTGPSALNSSASYAAAAAAAATAPSHGIVPSHYNAPAIEHSPYYSPLGSGYDMKNGEMWTAGDYGQPSPAYYQYDSGFAPQYPYDRYCGMDMNDGVRRKNATRESTNTLKAWLQEHKKNPYPTKGEKIMLAIITKMTLTQVSTWFANARRRLKKENKMTWVPKNRANESGSGAEDRRISDDKDIDEKSEDGDCKSEIGENEQTVNPCSSEVESEAKPVYPYAQEEGQKTLPYCQEQNSSIESQNTPDKSQIKAVFPTHILPPNGINAPLPTAADMTVSTVTQPRYDGMNEVQHRSIWSPIDNNRPPDHVSQQHMNRPYHQGYGTLSYYHGMYQQDMETDMHDRRTGINHQSQYLRHPSAIDIQNMQPHQTQMPPSSQHYPPSTRRIPPCNNSYTGDNLDKTKPIPDPLGQETRRSECRFSSPVTSLQNWVNGVFQAPRSTMSTGSPNSTIGDKTKSLNENADHAVSPANDCSQYHERGNYGQHRYVQPTNSMGTISNSSDPNNNDPYVVDHYPPEMISSSSYNSCGYYGEKSHNDVMRSYSYDAISGQQQQPSHTVPYYSNPINIRLRNSGEIPGPSKPISTTIAVTKTVPTGSPNHQDAAPCHEGILEQQTKVENTQSLMMYGGGSLTSHTTPVAALRVSVPALPQYNSPCQYSLNSTQSGHYMRNQSHSDFLALPKPGNQVVAQTGQESVSNASNLAHGALSPPADTSGNGGKDASTMECKMSPRNERNEIQAAEALTNLSTR